jgi:hypothetical protein
MTGAVIAQLIIAFGPSAIQLIQELVQIWNKELTPDEVVAFCNKAQKGYDTYIEEAKKNAGVV